MSEFAKDVDGRTDGRGASRASLAADPSSGDPTVSLAATRWSVGVIQAKLVVGAIDDALEREADRVAATVVSDLPRQRGPGLLDSVATTRIRSRSDFAARRRRPESPTTGRLRGSERPGWLEARSGSMVVRWTTEPARRSNERVAAADRSTRRLSARWAGRSARTSLRYGIHDDADRK